MKDRGHERSFILYSAFIYTAGISSSPGPQEDKGQEERRPTRPSRHPGKTIGETSDKGALGVRTASEPPRGRSRILALKPEGKPKRRRNRKRGDREELNICKKMQRK